MLEVALASDQNYFDGMLVTAGSIAKNCSQVADIRFHILDGGIDDCAFELMVECVKRLHPNTLFNRIKINSNELGYLPKWHGSRMAYARVFLPEILNSVEHIIYCDVDILWFADISRLWDMRDDEALIKGVRDRLSTRMLNAEISFAKRVQGASFAEERYINTGLVLMNLKAMRDDGFVAAAVKFMKDHPDLPLADQSMYNVLCASKIELLPEHWQTRSVSVKMGEKPDVVHYAGDNVQPWCHRGRWYLSYDQLLWFKANAEIRRISLWASLRMYSTVLCIVVRYGYGKWKDILLKHRR